MEVHKEYVVNFSRDEFNKLEEAVNHIEFLYDNFDTSVCEIDDDALSFDIKTLDYLFDQALSALNNLCTFAHEHCEK